MTDVLQEQKICNCPIYYLGSLLSLSSLRPCSSRGALFEKQKMAEINIVEYKDRTFYHFDTDNISELQSTRHHKIVLTLFPGGPEGPDSPVGPGEP